jgi:hypothetical protein
VVTYWFAVDLGVHHRNRRLRKSSQLAVERLNFIPLTENAIRLASLFSMSRFFRWPGFIIITMLFIFESFAKIVNVGANPKKRPGEITRRGPTPQSGNPT